MLNSHSNHLSATAKSWEMLANIFRTLARTEHPRFMRGQICDGLVPMKVKAGENIIHQGETGDKFYILEDGKAHAEKSGKGRVFEYGSGAFFGDQNVNPPVVFGFRRKEKSSS